MEVYITYIINAESQARYNMQPPTLHPRTLQLKRVLRQAKYSIKTINGGGGSYGQEGRLLGESSVRTTVSKDTSLDLSLPISKEGQELIPSVGVGECFILGISA